MRQAEKKIKGDKKMANIIKFEEKYSEQVYNLFMNVRDEEDYMLDDTGIVYKCNSIVCAPVIQGSNVCIIYSYILCFNFTFNI